MKKFLFLIIALSLWGCYSATLDCPCNGVAATASVGGQTALLDALLPLLSMAVKGGGLGLPLAAVSTTPPAPTAMCGHVDTQGIDLLGTATISCSTALMGVK